MALNKKQTSLVVKVIVVVVVLTFISLPIMSVIGSLDSGGSTAQTGQQGTSDSQIASQFKARIDANDATLAKNAKDYATLVDQANQYSDWATALLSDKQLQATGSYKPVFFTAIDYYKRALAVKPGDPAVSTDLAIAQFYYGDAAGAIKTAEGVMAKSPKFAPAFYNSGIFYAAVGENAKALAAFQTGLKLDPKAQSATYAKSRIEELKKAGPGSAVTPTRTP